MNNKFCPFNSPSHECNRNCVFLKAEDFSCNLASNAEMVDVVDMHFQLFKLNEIAESIDKQLSELKKEIQHR